MIVEFTDNSLTTSGDSGFDLWIFEVGSALEPTQIYVSEDGNEWIDVGATTGSTYGIDLDAYVDQGIVQGRKYRFVKLVDLLPSQSSSPYAGADVDAIGAISSAAPAYYGQYVDTNVVPDMNANSSQEMAILRYHPESGQPNVLLLDSATGETIRSIDFLTDRFKPISLDVLKDTDKNGYPNVSVLGISDRGICRIHIKDAFTRETIRRLNCPSN